MALVVVGSAKGSPGATTAALAMAALWPRPVVLADCDTVGGDVALRLPGLSGDPLDPDRGLVSLAAAGRNGLTADLLLAHTQQLVGGLEVLAGLRGPEQAAGLDAFWPAFGSVTARLPGIDVVVDAGRLAVGAPLGALLRAAHLLVLVTRPTVTGVVHTRERQATLLPALRSSPTSGPHLGVVLRATDFGRDARRDTQSAAGALAAAPAPPDRLWLLADDPEGAGLFEGRPVRRPERTGLVRSAAAVAAGAAELVAPFHRAVPAQPVYAVEPVTGGLPVVGGPVRSRRAAEVPGGSR